MFRTVLTGLVLILSGGCEPTVGRVTIGSTVSEVGGDAVADADADSDSVADADADADADAQPARD
jgi:hypothetical protein